MTRFLILDVSFLLTHFGTVVFFDSLIRFPTVDVLVQMTTQKKMAPTPQDRGHPFFFFMLPGRAHGRALLHDKADELAAPQLVAKRYTDLFQTPLLCIAKPYYAGTPY